MNVVLVPKYEDQVSDDFIQIRELENKLLIEAFNKQNKQPDNLSTYLTPKMDVWEL